MYRRERQIAAGEIFDDEEIEEDKNMTLEDIDDLYEDIPGIYVYIYV
jgi:hypothetical protein